MPTELINPEALGKPSGFSHASKSGNIIHLAGQTALTSEGAIIGGGIVQQFNQALSNILIALNSAGGKPSDLVSITIYLTDIPDYQAHAEEIGKIYQEKLGRHYPPMVGVEVNRLWQPEAQIEIQGIAITAG